jgi:Mannosylglycerate hydrolase MGH1-like glycoside hydrolase domain/Glycosyl hydrolase family 65, C-terminal domain
MVIAMRLQSGHEDHDAAYAKAIGDVAANIVDGRLIAGQRWDSIWTRDSCYALDLGAGLGVPEVGEATLRALTSRQDGGEVWTQDRAGHFGGWPHLSDASVGAIGLWAVYQATGDESLLRWGFEVTRASLARAEGAVFDRASGLFRGCASFMESNSAYPIQFAFNGPAVGRTKALSTNLVHYRAYVLAARMAALLGEGEQSYVDKAEALKQAINRRLWDPARGLYAYFEYAGGRRSSRMEGLGQALAILWGVADESQAEAVFKNTAGSPFGLPCLAPPYLFWRFSYGNDADYYHNGMVWPFVQGYWAWAAASRGNVDVFGDELEALTALSGRAGTFHEFYRPGGGVPDGSARQLWSAAGYLAMVHNGLFGLRIDAGRIRFAPVVPAKFDRLSLTGFRYRGMVLDLQIIGSGTRLAAFAVDGEPRSEPELPLELSGAHTVTLTVRA